MAYDIHVAKTLTIAKRQSPDFQFMEDIHKQIFSETYLWVKQAKLFSRLKDYYSDAHFSLAELPELRSELDRIIEEVNNLRVRELLVQFREVCRRAQVQQADIFCFCD